jgi:hypothetical protein
VLDFGFLNWLIVGLKMVSSGNAKIAQANYYKASLGSNQYDFRNEDEIKFLDMK